MLIQLGYEALGEAGVPEGLYFRLRAINNFNELILLFKTCFLRQLVFKPVNPAYKQP